MKLYRSLFRNRNFLLLWLGGAISSIGDFFNSLALVKVLSADPQHLGLWMALVMIAKVLPAVVLGPVAGVVADRVSRKTVMIATDLLRAGLVTGLVFTRQPSLIILLCGLAAAVATFHGPASGALLPSLVKPEELVSANSLNVMTQRAAMLLGNGLGALVLVWTGAHNVFYIDAVSFVICALFVAALAVPGAAAVHPAAEAARGLGARMISDLREMVTFIRQSPPIRKIFTTFFIASAADSAVNVGLVTFFTIDLGLAAERLGLIWALFGGASVLGALAVGALGNRVHWRHLISFGASYIWFTAMGMLLAHSGLGSGAFLTALGLGSGAINVGAQSAIGLLVPNEVRGRVFGGWGTVQNLVYVVGVLLAGWFSDRFGATHTLMGFSTFYLLAGIYAFFAFRRTEAAAEPPVAHAAD